MSGRDSLALTGGTPVVSNPWPRWPIYGDEESRALVESLADPKWGIDSDRVRAFEQEFARSHGAAHGIAVTSGTTALMVALRAAGVGAGDEVIVPDYTFMASASAALQIGAIPVLADIEPGTCHIDLHSADRRLSPRTRAIMPVHMAGMPVDMDAVNAFARDRGLAVVEDAAQAVGASTRGVFVGPIGTAGAFSFQSSKNATCGEGGIILTNDPDVAHRADMHRNCGRDTKRDWYRYYVPGANFRMTGFQIAVLNAQLARLPGQMDRRDAAAARLIETMRGIPGIEPPVVPEHVTRHAWHLFMFRYDSRAFSGLPRNRFIEALRAEGVPCSPGYALGLHEQAFMNDPESLREFLGVHYAAGRLACRDDEFPGTNRATREEAVWLYQWQLLASLEQVERIGEAIDKVQRLSSQIL